MSSGKALILLSVLGLAFSSLPGFGCTDSCKSTHVLTKAVVGTQPLARVNLSNQVSRQAD